MSPFALRNKLPKEQHALEYLLYAKFHAGEHGKDDDMGYVTKAWTPWDMLADFDRETRRQKVGAHLTAAWEAHDCAFPGDHPRRQACGGSSSGPMDSEETQTL